MKIAIAADGGRVTEHFGHCAEFKIFTIKDGKIINEENVANPGHRPGFLPNFLHDLGVKIIISGGMGGGAIDIFNEKGIKVITGAMGEAKDIVQSYLDGSLILMGNICDHSE